VRLALAVFAMVGAGVACAQLQAEGGLGVAPPMPEPVQRGDYCEVTISYEAAREELYGGAPLYRVTQNVQVHPADGSSSTTASTGRACSSFAAPASTWRWPATR